MPSRPRTTRLAVGMVPVVNDALMAGPVALGKLIPLVMLDTAERPDIDEAIRLHKHLPPGDVTTQWAENLDGGRPNVTLLLHFVRPADFTMGILFDLPYRAGLVDQIISTSFLYVQGGKPGDRLATSLDTPRILIEIAAYGFTEQWEEILQRSMRRWFREQGMSRQQAKRAASAHVQEWRKFGSLKMPRS